MAQGLSERLVIARTERLHAVVELMASTSESLVAAFLATSGGPVRSFTMRSYFLLRVVA